MPARISEFIGFLLGYPLGLFLRWEVFSDTRDFSIPEDFFLRRKWKLSPYKMSQWVRPGKEMAGEEMTTD